MTKNYEKLGEPLSAWKTYKPGPAQMVKYHECPNLPEGIVAVGDAFACFNPTYGQGLTTSSLAVLTLDRTLREFEEKGTKSIDGVSTSYHALVAERLQVPWMLPKAGDYSYPTTVTAEGETGDEMIYKLFQSYMCRVTQLTKVFPFVRLQWYKTIGMTDFGGKVCDESDWCSLIFPPHTLSPLSLIIDALSLTFHLLTHSF
jgi:hypothetical protein